MHSRQSHPFHLTTSKDGVTTTSSAATDAGSSIGAADAAAAVVAEAVAIALEAEAVAAAEQVLVTAAAIAAAADTAAGAAARARGARAFAVAEAARLVATDAVRTATALQDRADVSAAFFAEGLRQSTAVIAAYDPRGTDSGAQLLAMRLIATMRAFADVSASESAAAAGLVADAVAVTAAELAVAASAVDVGVETEVTDAADALRGVSLAAAGRVAATTAARAAGVAMAAEEAAAVRVEQNSFLDETRDDVIAIASHELRTPLASISAHAEMLQDSGGLTPTQTGFVDAIARNVGRLTSLTDDLLLLARSDSTLVATESLEVDLRAVLSSAAEVTATLGLEKNIQVLFELPDDPMLVTGEARQLERVVLNLMSNAIKFTENGGAVTCRLSSSSSDVFMTFTDTGVGIPPAEQELLFERFFRGSGARLRGIRGTGLGLHIVATIVSNHGGDISVESVLGQGSVFTVRLPRRIA